MQMIKKVKISVLLMLILTIIMLLKPSIAFVGLIIIMWILVSTMIIVSLIGEFAKVMSEELAQLK